MSVYTLVTGAGGTIGSEICRRLDNVLALGHGEHSLYKLDCDCKKVLADIRDEQRMEEIFADHYIERVYHTAAHKHVGFCEDNPGEAISNNVLGTQNLIRLCKKYGVQHFVYMSTDKAVEPINVMGLTKRLGEIITIDAGYTVVRSGNIVGSRGSVIPKFRELIEQGKKVPITHPSVERYFITVEDAVDLILQADENKIYVLDMGEPYGIFDLAVAMGAKDIEFIGLQPGEKLTEKLWYDFEEPEKRGEVWVI